MTLNISEPDAEAQPTADSSVSRRSVLKAFGIGGVAVAVTATGVVSYRVFENGVIDSGSGSPYDAWSEWRSDPEPLGAVATAILAANPHNTQPWLFQVTASTVEIFADATRRMRAVDPFDREHHVGLGCALENLTLGLGARGFASSVTLLPDPTDESHLATVDFTGAGRSGSRLYDVIGDRHSNRGPYRPDAVSPEVLRQLADEAVDFPGVDVRWFVSAADKSAVADVMMAATEAFIADDGQSREAFSWFRNNRDDIEKYRDGPTLDAQGLSPVKLALAKILPATSRVAGDKFWRDQTRTVHTATAAAYGILTVENIDDVAARLTAGRVLQRIHLAATAAGLGLQHMNQITERIDREREQGMAPMFAGRFQDVLGQPGRLPLVTFRLGHPVHSALKSPRRTLDVVTL